MPNYSEGQEPPQGKFKGQVKFKVKLRRREVELGLYIDLGAEYMYGLKIDDSFTVMKFWFDPHSLWRNTVNFESHLSNKCYCKFFNGGRLQA